MTEGIDIIDPENGKIYKVCLQVLEGGRTPCVRLLEAVLLNKNLAAG
jgi:uncharacterized protein (DUF2147 family)